MKLIRNRIDILLVSILGVLCSIPVWITRYPAIIDFPLHIAKAQIARHPELYRGVYIYNWVPRPYMFFDLCTVIIGWFLPILTSGKMVVTLYVVTALMVTVYLLYKDNAPLFPMLLWTAFGIFNWWYGVGSLNLLFGHLFGILCVIWYYHHAAGAHRRVIAAVTGFLALILLCHPMSFLITVSLLILMTLWLKSTTVHWRMILITGYVSSVIVAAVVLHIIFKQPWTPGETAGQLLWLLHDYRPVIETKVFKVLLVAMAVVWFTQPKDLLRSVSIPLFLLFIMFVTPTRVDMAGHIQLRIMQYFILALPFFVPSPRGAVPRGILSCILAAGAGTWIFLQCQKQLHYIGCFTEAEQMAVLMPERPRVHILQQFTSAPHQHAGFYCVYFKGGSISSLYETPFWGIRFDNRYRDELLMIDTGRTSIASYSHLIYFKDDESRPAITEDDISGLGFRKVFEGKWLDCYENGNNPSRLHKGQ